MVSAPADFVAGIWNNYIYTVNARQENEKLHQELDLMRVQCMNMEELRHENRRLRAMLEFKKAYHDFELHPASLLTQDITLVFKTAVIDRGKRDGFYEDMPVVTPAGVMGRVISASPSTSQVLLITDPNRAIPVLIESSRVKGVLKGSGHGYLTLEYVRRTEQFAVGDKVVTSGLLGIFPKGLMVGSVKDVRKDERNIFAEVVVDPFVEMDTIEEVFGISWHAQQNR